MTLPDTPEGLLTLVLGFTISGNHLYPEVGERREATHEEQKMWAALLFQAQNALRTT